MTSETRQRVFQYGIAIDLVILATGLGFLYPNARLLIIGSYIAAAALSAWKGGWRPAALSIALSALLLLALFGSTIGASAIVAFVAASAVATAIIQTSIPGRRVHVAVAPAPTGDVVAFELRLDREQQAREAEQRREMARALERAATEQLERVSGGQAPPPVLETPTPTPTSTGEGACPSLDPVEARVAEHRTKLRNETNLRVAREVKRIRRELEQEFEQQLADELRRERESAEGALGERLQAERASIQAELERRLAAEREAVHAEAERLVADQLAPERDALRAAAEERLQREREQLRRSIEERLTQAITEESRAAEETLQKRIEERRATIRKRTEEQSSAAPKPEPPPRAEAPPPPPARKISVKRDTGGGVLSRITGWLPKVRRRKPVPAKKIVGSGVAPRRPAATAAPAVRPLQTERKPRLLMVERRRGTADAIAPKVKQRGVEVEIVERWVDAVDEIFRFRPDALMVDGELPDFGKIYTAITLQRPNLPIFVTGKMTLGTTSSLDRHAGFVARPYDAEALAQIARQAMADPQQLVAKVVRPAASPVAAPSQPTPEMPNVAPESAPLTMIEPRVSPSSASYIVPCFNCHMTFDAMTSDWCSCLTKERTVVCTNCLACFCKAPPSYKEKFWMNAPAQLNERKPSELRKQEGVLAPSPPREAVTRPLVLCVEDDEDIQIIVQRVCSNLGYGFVHAENGVDGLEAARLYEPDLILADAFMPKLDGREMCRMYKEEADGDCAVVVMTGLYTDTKYRSEALKRFHVDEYLAKPVAVTALVHLFQKHLEGATPAQHPEELPPPEPSAAGDDDDDRSIPLSTLLEQSEVPAVVTTADNRDSYEVCCHHCNQMFDAVHAEWCTCLGRDQTLVCTHCGWCFCRAPSVYKERFWIDAPPSLFERKMLGSKRNTGGRGNPTTAEVRRPLILLVEDDENIQLIVRTVVTTMGYGFIVGANGQEGLTLAREYNPDLILSDAFMPKLDGREMCRLLKEDPSTARVKAIIMTGLYTDRKYRNEALDYFKVDDYVAKPVAVDDLIKLFKKHLPQEVQPTM
jgi:CheY-like chemotaxis protein